MDILQKIEGLEAKFHEVSLLLTDPAVIADQARYVRLNREYHDLERVLQAANQYRQTMHDLDDAKQLFHNSDDNELREMAREGDDEMTVQFLKEVNGKLAERGIKAVELPVKVRRRLEAAGAAPSNTKEEKKQ